MTLPDRMQFVEIRTPGPAAGMAVSTGPVPVAGAGEVLVRVRAAGINRPDIRQRMGLYPPPPGASAVPGLEIAGEIAAVGDGVTAWKPGDAVCALVNSGGYAEYCAAPAGQCLPVPRGLTFVEASSLPETYFTVWSNVFGRGGLQPGETLLVQGGASGIGVAAIQLAKAFGCRVLATVGSDDKCAFIERLGAARAINYRREDFAAVALEFTEGQGVDVILDMVGGDYAPRELGALAFDGRLVMIAQQGGSEAKLSLETIMRRRLTVTGSTLRPRSVEFKSQIAKELRGRVWPLLEKKVIRPVVDSTFPLGGVVQAHERMESRQHVGKIVLDVREGNALPG